MSKCEQNMHLQCASAFYMYTCNLTLFICYNQTKLSKTETRNRNNVNKQIERAYF